MHGEYLEYEEDVIKMLFNVKKIEDFDLFMICEFGFHFQT